MPRLLAFALAFALAIPASASTLRPRAGAYELQVLVDGRPVRSFSQDGDTWLLGQLGERYTLRVFNRSPRQVEAVVSVDGRDVIDGETASTQKGGYLVPAYGTVDIDGWRISHQQAAAFRFSSVANSYAARTRSGREVGVIGVAIFEETVRPPPPPPVSVVPRREPDYPGSCCMSGSNDAQPSDDTAKDGESAQRDQLESETPAIPTSAAPPMDAPAPAPAPPFAPRAEAMPSPAKSMAPADSQGYASNSGSTASGLGGLGLRGEPAHAEAQKKKARAGLGTEYGETVSSYIHEVAFERASARPSALLGARYNDREGLIALGIDVDGTSEQTLRKTAEPFPVVERGFAQPPPGWSR